MARRHGAPVDPRGTLDDERGQGDVAALLGAPGVRRIVASGNGAAYYVAVALWLASLEDGRGPRGRRRAERTARARGVRLAARRRPARHLLVGRVPRPRRGGRRRRARAVRRRDCERGVDARRTGRSPRARLGPEPACRHAHAGVLRRGRCGARRVGEDDGRRGTRGGAPSPAGASSRLRSPARGRGSTTWQLGARDGGRVRQRPGVGGRARGRAAPQGGRRAPGRGRRDPGGGDFGDDGARPRRSGAEPDRQRPTIRCSPRPRTSAPGRGRP